MKGEFAASRSNTVGMPPGVKFSGWLEKTPAGVGVAAARLVMPGGTKTETFCFLPFSSTVKSSGFRPVTGCPFLWVTTTSTTTSRVLARIVMVGTSAGAWALKMVGPAARFRIKAEASRVRKGRLHNIGPPRVHRNSGNTRNVSCFRPFGKPYPSELWTPVDDGKHLHLPFTRATFSKCRPPVSLTFNDPITRWPDLAISHTSNICLMSARSLQ